MHVIERYASVLTIGNLIVLEINLIVSKIHHKKNAVLLLLVLVLLNISMNR